MVMGSVTEAAALAAKGRQTLTRKLRRKLPKVPLVALPVLKDLVDAYARITELEAEVGRLRHHLDGANSRLSGWNKKKALRQR